MAKKKQEDGLQKFTKFDEILSMEQVTDQALDALNEQDRSEFFDYVGNLANTLKGQERDQLLYKLDPIMAASTKRQIWEQNHQLITRTISKCLRKSGTMPTTSLIAQESGLSRQTVVKHLKEYKESPEYLKSQEQFKFLKHKVLAEIVRMALRGDVRAARLYLEATGELGTQGQKLKQTNIQINGLTINQDMLQKLSPDQVTQIQEILLSVTEPEKLALPRKN